MPEEVPRSGFGNRVAFVLGVSWEPTPEVHSAASAPAASTSSRRCAVGTPQMHFVASSGNFVFTLLQQRVADGTFESDAVRSCKERSQGCKARHRTLEQELRFRHQR